MASEDIFEFCQDGLESGSLFRSTFENMWRSSELTDVSIRIEDRTFRAHRMVLAAVFPFFKAMFRCKLPDSRKREIALKDVDPDALECLINYAYTGKIVFTDENATELLIAANYMQLTEVQEGCVEFLSRQFRPNNILDLRALGEHVSCKDFVRKADSFITENFEALRKTDGFLKTPFWLLKEIVSRRDLKVKRAENVIKAIAKWVKARPERITVFIELLNCVQMRLPSCENCAKLNEQLGKSPKVPQRSLLDLPHAGDDVFGIYTVCSSPSTGRIVHNFSSYTRTWSVVAEHTGPRSFTAVVSACGQIYAFTRDNLEVFDRSSWKRCGLLPWQVRSRSGNAVSRGRKIYWFPNISSELCSVWCLDIESKTWSEESPSVKVISAGYVSLWKHIYILGGISSSTVTADARTYDPHWKEFDDVQPMLSRRSSPGCVTLDDKIYVCGGYNGSFPLDSAEVYDPLGDQWQYISRMRNQRTNFSLVTCDHHLYAVSLQTNQNASVECYDPEKDRWESGPAFPWRCSYLRALAISV